MNKRKPVKDRFEDKIFYSPCGCWYWTGPTSSNGYGNFWLNGTAASAHKTAFQLYKGEVPDGLCVCHSCDVRNCVNPDHLFLGTSSDNRQDMFNKGRGNVKSGESHPHAKLNWEIVDSIRAIHKAGFIQKEIAKLFDLHKMTVRDVVRNITWKR